MPDSIECMNMATKAGCKSTLLGNTYNLHSSSGSTHHTGLLYN